jgi:adenine C2-methylase RlmN of 23S rRNA A2503 and tRNA A37
MEAFRTDDGSVAKFIHDDGSETAVKVVKSCSNFRTDDGRVHTEWVDRNKFSVFISASLGCYMACPFCHLTIKGSQYRKLYTDQVVANVKEAILAELQCRPEMRERYVKLCWMGMGDAINQPDMVHDATLELMEWLMGNGYTRGLDCVDLSTVLPPVKDGWLDRFVALNKALEKYPANPDSFKVEQAEVATHTVYRHRSRFRMFWSVHSAIQSTRDKMVPKAMPLAHALPKLRDFAQAGPNLLLHQLFVEGLNDSPAEVEALLELLAANFPDQELRVLRYNFCDRSPYREWDHIDDAVARIADQHPALKVQVSAGREVAAACGQFLVAHPRSVKKRIAVIPVPSAEHTPVSIATAPRDAQ